MLTDLVNQYSSSRIELRLYATPATPTYGEGRAQSLKRERSKVSKQAHVQSSVSRGFN